MMKMTSEIRNSLIKKKKERRKKTEKRSTEIKFK